MFASSQPLAAAGAPRPILYRLAIPLLALAGFAAFALMWGLGYSSLSVGIIRSLGIKPWDFPFLDAHAVLAAAECQRQGVNIYIENPCDVLNRVHVYSPLWLTLIPGWLGTADLNAVGLALDLLFILSLGVVFRPPSFRDIAIFAIGVFSPITVFALERANNDIVIFILVVAAALLWSASYGSRVGAYAVYLLAGLLKFYPLVLLAFVFRERLRRALPVLVCSAAAVLVMALCYGVDLRAAIGNIPKLPYFTEPFSAQNLPYGMLEVTGTAGIASYKIIMALLILAALSAATLWRGWHMARRLGPCEIDWTEWETRLLVTASLLLPACFFTAQNVSYRGIYLLLALPGLVHLRDLIRDPSLRRWLTRMLAGGLVIMWGECLRHAYDVAVGLPSPEFANSRVYVFVWVLLWIGRELLWWWLIAGFIAFAVAFVRSQPLTNEVLPRLRRLMPAPAR